MQMQTGKKAAQRIKGFVSSRHQVHAYHVELTAGRVYTLNPTGAVDFGGSELLPAEPIPLSTYQKHSQDKYEWWGLVHGAYLVECNESMSLADAEIALIEPHERLLKAGAGHATRFLRGTMDPVYLMLEVPSGKIEMKQNARISALRIFSLGDGSAKTARRKKAAKNSSKRKKARRSAKPKKTAKRKKAGRKPAKKARRRARGR